MIEVLAGAYGIFVSMYGAAVNNPMVILTGLLICYLSYRDMKE